MAPIIYAVSAVKSLSFGKDDPYSRLAYGTVEREILNGQMGYVITSRAGDVVHIGADSIDALITALIQARNEK